MKVWTLLTEQNWSDTVNRSQDCHFDTALDMCQQSNSGMLNICIPFYHHFYLQRAEKHFGVIAEAW